MNIAIVGYATEGTASARYFVDQGHDVTICDKSANIEVAEEFATQLGNEYLHNLDRFDMIVRSAGIHPKVILAENPNVADKITTAINEFLEQSPSRNIIGITGTKGKGTTSTLTADILKAHGETVWLGGNIGLSPLEFIDKIAPDDWVVLELSSFQLYDIKTAPRVAACLMVVPEHLDWHANLEDYYSAKSNLFRHQNSDDIAIYYAANSDTKKIAENSMGRLAPYYVDPGARVGQHGQIEIEESVTICQTDELKLIGKHNWQNVCAAITIAWQAGCKDVARTKQAVTSFPGLPHRLEFVRELSGIRYFNDSYAATPDASMAALDAIKGSKVVIIGGFDRKLPIEHFAAALKAHAGDTTPLLIGASAERMADTCVAVGMTKPKICTATTMKAVLQEAITLSKPGYAVILSPGFASFDMFKNFEDRGEQFKREVNAL